MPAIITLDRRKTAVAAARLAARNYRKKCLKKERSSRKVCYPFYLSLDFISTYLKCYFSIEMGNTTNILIIEDHEIVIWGLERMVIKAIEGAIVYSAPSFEKGLQVLVQNRIELIILDIGVPGGNSTETIARLRGVQPGVRVLIHTGLSEIEHAAAYIMAGANGFISKHALFEDVLDACKTVLQDKKYVSELVRKSMANSF